MFEKRAKVVESTRPDELAEEFFDVDDLIFIAFVALIVTCAFLIAFLYWLIA